MKYMGSKARIAKYISPIINATIQSNGIDIYIEPFVGGANMIQHVDSTIRLGYDNNPYLIAFWKAIKCGWNPLEDVQMTKELYLDIKSNPEKYPQKIVALAGFCASYNAKWFGGYAGIVKTKINTYRNYYDESVRNVLKQADYIMGVEFNTADYRQIKIKNTLIYCDPPYQGTTGYKDRFDHSAYWDWVREMSKDNIVLCSEYRAPEDFKCVWQKQLTTTLDNASRSRAVEKLFLHKSNADLIELEF